jgi:hypothetical protein
MNRQFIAFRSIQDENTTATATATATATTTGTAATAATTTTIYYLCAESTATRPITDTAQCRYK